jgi:hypothetical protein
MAHWKRLTGGDGRPCDVNLDTVAYMVQYEKNTTLFFVGGRSSEGRSLLISVKETPDEIHQAAAVPSM